MHGYLFPMPIAVGPFPHPSYDTTAGEFLSFSSSSSFPKGSGKDLGCVSVLWFSCCKFTWPRPLESSFTNQCCLFCCPRHTLRGSPTFSLLQPGCAGVGCASSHVVLSTYSCEQGRRINPFLSHLLTLWEELEPDDANPARVLTVPEPGFPG